MDKSASPDKLRRFIEKFYPIAGIPMALLSPTGELLLAVPAQESAFLKTPELLCRIRKEMSDPVAFFHECDKFFYGLVQVQEKLLVLGPLARQPVSLSASIAYRQRHQMKGELAFARTQIDELAGILSFLALELCDIEIESDSIRACFYEQSMVEWQIEQDEETYRLETSEWERDHDSAEWENRLIEIVKTGDLEAAQKRAHGHNTLELQHVGVVAEKEEKQLEYLIVTMLSIVSRAAVSGGLNQEQAYGLADVYLQRLEKCKTVAEMSALSARATYDFTKRVHDAKISSSNSSYIEQCKAYIEANLRKNINVEDIAKELGFTRPYLTKKFVEAEGIGIHKYMMQKRCEHAANMLRYSEYPIALIGEYFCFSSQSHFGKVFKEYYGMTPAEYRNLNKVF